MSDEQTPDVPQDQQAGAEPPASAEQATDDGEATRARGTKGRRARGRAALRADEPPADADDAAAVPAATDDADEGAGELTDTTNDDEADAAAGDEPPPAAGLEGEGDDVPTDAGLEGIVGDLRDPELFDPDEVANAPRAPHPLKPVLEALIFASPEPLTVKAMVRLLEEHTKEEIEAALEEVRETYVRSDGLQLVEVAGGFQIVTRPELYEWVRRLFKERSTSKLSVQALETLAVIAYKQPVTSGEIAEIRGVSATTGVLNTLLDRKLVKIVGRKQVVGRPFMYGTTREFLDKFGLRDLSDLPKVEDMSEALGFDLPNPVDEGDGVSLPFEGPVEPMLFEGEAPVAAMPADSSPDAAAEPDVASEPEAAAEPDREPSAAGDDDVVVAADVEVAEASEAVTAGDPEVEDRPASPDTSESTDASGDER